MLPEDDANRQIVNGFRLNPNLNDRAIQVLPPARGWKKVVEKFTKEHAPEMRQYSEIMIVFLIDFDESENRLSYVQSQIPDDLKERVFVLGVLSEPERLKKDINKNFEKIGEALAKDCSDNTNELWGHPLLEHNKAELDRMILAVKPFLFN
ncbi:hypothetical protein ACE1CM_29545 [Microseira sp. BLCC-F43]